MREPNLFLIGAPKCGTTSLAAYLDQHPQIVVSKPKEPRYFVSFRDVRKRSYEEYLRCFASATREAWVCDATPDYLCSEESIFRISERYPKARYIVAIRRQADLAFSLHQEQVYNGMEDILDFEEAWRAQVERRSGARIPITCRDPQRLDYEKRIELGAQLSRALKFIDRERIFFVDFDALKNEPDQVMSKLFAFLDVAQFNVPDLVPRNLRKEVRWPILLKMAAFMYIIKRGIGMRGSLSIAHRIRSLGVRPAKDRPKMAESLRAEIDNKYADDWKLIESFARSGPGAVSSMFD